MPPGRGAYPARARLARPAPGFRGRPSHRGHRPRILEYVAFLSRTPCPVVVAPCCDLERDAVGIVGVDCFHGRGPLRLLNVRHEDSRCAQLPVDGARLAQRVHVERQMKTTVLFMSPVARATWLKPLMAPTDSLRSGIDAPLPYRPGPRPASGARSVKTTLSGSQPLANRLPNARRHRCRLHAAFLHARLDPRGESGSCDRSVWRGSSRCAIRSEHVATSA